MIERILLLAIILLATSCVGDWKYPKGESCTILSDGCICTNTNLDQDDPNYEYRPDHKCYGYYSVSPEMYEALEKNIANLEKEWKECKLNQRQN